MQSHKTAGDFSLNMKFQNKRKEKYAIHLGREKVSGSAKTVQATDFGWL